MDEIYRNYVLVRIRSKSKPVSSGCIEWQGVKNNKGYGLISITLERMSGKRTIMLAHRAYFMAYHSVLLTRYTFICHTCDNPSCVNIEHLFLGTPGDNNRDCINKGRRARNYKYHHRIRRHAAELVERIRSDNSGDRLVDMATKYGVSVSYISKIRNNKLKR